MWLIDTCTLIDITKRNPNENAVKKIKEIDKIPATKAISVITAYEFLFGIYYRFRSRDKKLLSSKLSSAEIVLSRFEILQIDYNIAKKAAELDANLTAKGIKIGLSDLFIASTAIYHDLTLITKNIKHFENIPGIKLESY